MDPASIAKRRHELGMTQTELAGHLGVTLRTVQHWEGGTRKPTRTALKLLKTLKPKRKADQR